MADAGFDVERLVEDLGGASKVAEMTGSPRTAPYRWMRTGQLSSSILARIKKANPSIDLDDYFVVKQ